MDNKWNEFKNDFSQGSVTIDKNKILYGQDNLNKNEKDTLYKNTGNISSVSNESYKKGTSYTRIIVISSIAAIVVLGFIFYPKIKNSIKSK